MNQIYIQDSTLGNKYVTFDTIPQLLNYFNELIPRAFNMSRNQFIQNLIDLGYGYDDPDGVMLTRAMSDQFNIGIVKDNNYVKTDVHESFHYHDENYGSSAVNRFEDRGKF